MSLSETIECICGCGETLTRLDARGRERSRIYRHWRNRQGTPMPRHHHAVYRRLLIEALTGPLVGAPDGTFSRGDGAEVFTRQTVRFALRLKIIWVRRSGGRILVTPRRKYFLGRPL